QAQRIGPRTFLLRRAEDTPDLIAPREKRFHHRFAKILLPDERDPHSASALAGFGGIENAPACLLAAIWESSQPNTSLSISSVCSPNVGDRSIFAGDSESLMGMPTLYHLTRCGWASSTYISRPRTCSSLARSSVDIIRPQGT